MRLFSYYDDPYMACKRLINLQAGALPLIKVVHHVIFVPSGLYRNSIFRPSLSGIYPPVFPRL
jgi:hypothetical protein